MWSEKGDRETRRQGDKEMGRQGRKWSFVNGDEQIEQVGEGADGVGTSGGRG